ncbi:MAG: hypothetical protein ACOC3C_02090 [Candidatus Thorarchaeota archaeon]
MPSDIERVMRWFYRRTFTSRTYTFDDLLLDAAFSVLGKAPMDAHAFVHRNANMYWTKVVERMQEEARLGRTPLFDIVDRSSRRIAWPPARYSLGHKNKRVFRRLFNRPEALQAIDALTDRQYETFPCLLVEVAGRNLHHLTPHGDEWGVDFFATVRNPSQLSVFDGYRVPIRIVGQCKKYNSPLQVGAVKEFSRTLDGLRNRKRELEKHVPAWFRASSGPIFPWIICHSGFQSGARSLAQDEGMVASDSVDLAECFCLLRQRRSAVGTGKKRDFIRTRCQKIIGDD